MADLEQQGKNLEDLSNKLEKVTDNTSEFRTNIERLDKVLSKQDKTTQDAFKSAMIYQAAIAKAEGNVEEFLKISEKLSDNQQKQARSFAKMAKEEANGVDSLKKRYGGLNSEIEDLIKNREKQNKQYHREKVKEKVFSVAGKTPGLGKHIGKGRGAAQSASMMGKSLIGTGSKVLGSLGGAMTKLAGPAGVAITALSALGAAIKFVAKKVVELDHFHKELNREYLKMAGPTVGGKALRNMEEFNKSLFCSIVIAL